MNTSVPNSPFAIDNVKLFIRFRIFFNARFYYPVFTILFLDFGLTIDQFTLLNAVWAASIVLLEVPSGALADIIGRRKLLVITGFLMVIEISLFCFVPMGNIDVLFIVLLINRILSGAAEAAASGADEALAYDSLKQEGLSHKWGVVLEKQMRVQSIAFIAAMSTGAAIYDPRLMQIAADALGLNIVCTQEMTLRFPLYLTLIMAVMALVTTLQMKDILTNPSRHHANKKMSDRSSSLGEAFKITLKAGKWILKTPFALILIMTGMLFDHIIRMLLTLNSQYLRMIDIPEATFGLIGSATALMGIVMPRLSLRLTRSHSPQSNLYLLALITFIGLIGMSRFFPIWGLIPMFVLYSGMLLSNFFVSHYLNEITDSDQRATVLSFKGLTYNLAYGLMGIAYSMLLIMLRSDITAGSPMSPENIENLAFIRSISWVPWYFVCTLVPLLIFARYKLGSKEKFPRSR